MSHILVRGFAFGMDKMRRDIGRIKWGNFTPSKEMGITVLVDQDGGRDLALCSVWEAQKMSMQELGEAIKAQVMKIKEHKNSEHKAMAKTSSFAPPYVLSLIQPLFGYLTNAVGWNLSFAKLKANNTGQTVITNIGSLDMEEGFAPFCPPCQAEFLACMGKAVKKPVVTEGDKIEVKPIMKVVYTLDHRFGDASLTLKMFKILKDYIEDPEHFDPSKY
eukprot:CAMPEP_0202965026 /NCGR_PEP_ID=MMETSP1396-20130829/9142_1 /ASSEMBLY_ACC=CAM_ASM_000872 /TAXON_ID= /ORGANISM="Pseudokeronopsis sp., Strain Brazil" /LENGTH=217 /DNA_ID=CAMNT_0049687611 /DNA_START=282 /DNA_END=935 /DNA_ORIENTATION=-